MSTQQNQPPSFFKKITYTDSIYPLIQAEVIQNPNRFFAIPLIGLLSKLIILTPVFIEVFFLSIWWLVVVMIINPFVVLLSGKYWSHAYDVAVGLYRLITKISFYLYGLTDKYPGFDFNVEGRLEFNLAMPEKSSRFFAIPVLGGTIRVILLIPYFIFENIISQAANIGVLLLAWVVVLFKGKYPEGIFELARDSVRVNTSSLAYMSGLSDRYPSFYVSMTHDKIKLILIGFAIILNGWSYVSGESASQNISTN